MGLLDGVFGYFGSLGATVTQTVTRSQPAPSGGGTYTGGGTTATSQPAQPVQVQPQSPFSDPVGWIGGATSFVSSGVQTIVSPIVRPIQNAVPMVAAVAAAPAIIPMAIGAVIMGGVQSFTSPQQQPVSAPITRGASYTPMTVPVVQSAPQPTTFNVPYGSQAKIQVEDAKMVYDPTGGGVGFYQVPKSAQPGFTRIYGFVTSSGGPGALQSGQFTQGKERAGTPVVYTQRGAASKEFAAGVDVAAAMDVINNPEKYSRQGAEAYGGTVQLLDNRILAPTAQMGRYPPESGNLANLVSPTGVNLKKDQWAEIPWKIQGFKSAPTIQSINVAGTMTPVGGRELASIGMAVPVAPDRLIGGGKVAGVITVSDKGMGLPAPFRSGVTPEQYKLDVSAYTSSLGTYKEDLAQYEAGGSTDKAMYSSLTTRFTALESEKKTLDIKRGIISAPTSQNIGLVDKPGPVAFSTNLALMGVNVARTGDIGQLYSDFTQSIAMSTTHAMPSAKGFGKWVETQGGSSSPVSATMAGLAYFGEAVYTDIREDPIQDIALMALPGAFKYGERLVVGGVAKMATRGAIQETGYQALKHGRVISAIGKGFSSPAVSNIAGTVIKGALVAPWVYESAKSVIDAPMTPEGKFTALGHVGYQVGMIGVGEVAFARNMVMTSPDNPYAGRKFFSGKRAQGPITSVVDEGIILAARGELRLRGMKQEAAVLKETWTITKYGRYIEPPRRGTGDVLLDVTGIPVEHVQPLGKAVEGGGFFGSGPAYGQVKTPGQFKDPRIWDLELMRTKKFRNLGTMKERFAAQDVARPDITTGKGVSPDYPVAKGSDIDVFKTPELVKAKLMDDPGAMVQIRVPKTTVTTPHPQYPGISVESEIPGTSRFISGTRALGEIEASEAAYAKRSIWVDLGKVIRGEAPTEKGIGFGDIQNIYAHGAKYNVDVKSPSDWYVKLPYETGPRTADSYSPADWKQPIVFKIFGSPFARSPLASDVWTGKGQVKEKLGFQVQRGGDAISKDIMSLRESGIEGDPLFRGYRTEKDVYHFTSDAQQLFAADRIRIAGGARATLSTRQLGKADAAVARYKALDIRYQPAKGEPEMVAKMGDLMEIGVERLNVGLTVGGDPVGPTRTSIGDPKFLKEYPAPERSAPTDWIRKDLAAPRKGTGVSLADIPYQKKPSSLQAAEFLAREGRTAPEMPKVDMQSMVGDEIKLGAKSWNPQNQPAVQPRIPQVTPAQPNMPSPSTVKNIPGDVQFWGTSQPLSEAEIISKLALAERYGLYPVSSKGTTKSPQWDVLRSVGKKYGYDVGNPVAETAFGQGDYAIVRKGTPQFQAAPKPVLAAEWLAKSRETIIPLEQSPRFDTRDILLETIEPAYTTIIKISSPSGATKPLLKPIVPVSLSIFRGDQEQPISKGPEPPRSAQQVTSPVIAKPREYTLGKLPSAGSTPATGPQVTSAIEKLWTVPSGIGAVLGTASILSPSRKPEYATASKPQYATAEKPVYAFSYSAAEKPPYVSPPEKSTYGVPTTPPPFVPSIPLTPPPSQPSPPPPIKPPYVGPPPPPSIVPPFGALPPGGGGSPFGKKRRRNFLETFWMGLDVAGPIMKPPKGMQPPKLKRSGIPGGRQKVKVTRRKKTGGKKK